MILSKNIIKQLKSLDQKKFRNEKGIFLAEGTKIVCDNIDTMKCEFIIATQNWFDSHQEIPDKIEKCIATIDEIKKISFLKTPQEVLGVFTIPQYNLDNESIKTKLSIVLDTVQDPGNMGTIIRIADWYGIENIICSLESADIFSPKVVQSSMGAVSRVKVHYTNLETFLSDMKGMDIFGTFLEGENIYKKELPQNGLIIMGNEGKGISDKVASYVTEKLFIPNYPQDRLTTESLNVAVATAIICSEFRRGSY